MRKLFLFQRLNRFLIFLLIPLNIYGTDISRAPTIWNVGVSNDYFVGRSDKLIEIDDAINANQKAIIVGQGGVGKTQLAKQYAHDHYKNYEIIWWFDMAKNMDDQFINLAHLLIEHNIAANKIDIDSISAGAVILFVKNTLRQTNKSWLVIFDSMERNERVKEYLPELHNNKHHHIIVTSRKSNELLPVINLENFTEREALEFTKIAINDDMGNENDKDSKNSEYRDKDGDDAELNKFIKLLNCYPIALAQAAAYIKINHLTIHEYIKLYNHDPLKLIALQDEIIKHNHFFDLNKKTLKSTLDINLKTIKKESKPAFIIIEVMSLIDVPRVPEVLLSSILKDCGYSQDDFKRGISILQKYLMIEEQRENMDRFYKIHDFVKLMVKKNLTTPSYFKKASLFAVNELYSKILKVLVRKLETPWGQYIDYINNNPELMNIATSVALSCFEQKLTDPLLPTLMIYLLEHNNMIFHLRNNYKLYQRIAENLHELIHINNIPISNELKARFYTNSIYADYIFADKKVTDFYEQEFIKYIELLDIQTPERFLGYLSLAKFHLIKGNIKAALSASDKAFSMISLVNNIGSYGKRVGKVA